MGKFTTVLAGIVSAVVFVIVFSALALPALAIVEDDNAFVTWSVLIACVTIGIVAAQRVNRWMLRRWSR